MANAYIVPFDFTPFSTTIKTGAYTIPAGYRARVRPTSLETDFTIDAVIAVEKTKYIGSGSTSGTIFTNTSPYFLIGGVTNDGNVVSLHINHPSNVGDTVHQRLGNCFALGSTASNYVAGMNAGPQVGLAVPADCLVRTDGSGTKYYAFDAHAVGHIDWFWVPTDTDLNGSRYVVELYALAT